MTTIRNNLVSESPPSELKPFMANEEKILPVNSAYLSCITRHAEKPEGGARSHFTFLSIAPSHVTLQPSSYLKCKDSSLPMTHAL